MAMRLFYMPLFLILALSGCASTERFQREMDSYLGWDIQQLRERFGFNYIERDLGDDTRAYTWVWSERNLNQGYQSPDVIHSYTADNGSPRVVVSPGTYFPPSYSEYQCEFSFITDTHGRVTRWRAQGSGCVVYPGPETVLQHGAVPVAPP